MPPLSFASAPGALFNILGKIGAFIANQRSNQATQFTALVSQATGIDPQLVNEPDIQAIIGSSYISLLDNIGNGGGTMQGLAAAAVNRKVFRAQAQYNQTLTQADTLTSLQYVIQQMKIAGATVLSMTITGTPAGFVGAGNGVVTFSVKRPLDGLVLENTFSEIVIFTCNNDSYNGSATQGNEGFIVTGQGAQTNLFAFNWPLGSNCSIGLNAIDGEADNSSGNLLTNSGFDAANWTGSVPNNWTIVSGGSLITLDTGNTFGSTGALCITGDGTTLVDMRQEFNTATGTLGILDSQTQYSVNVFIRRDGVAPGAGRLTVDFVDVNGITILDANNVANTYNIDLTQLTTSYASYSCPFRTPVIVPDQVFFRLYNPVGFALSAGRAVYADRISVGSMSQLYVSGPFVAVHSGNFPYQAGDFATLTFSNSRGAGGTYSTFQTLVAILMPNEFYGNELLLPSSLVPSISDSLIS